MIGKRKISASELLNNQKKQNEAGFGSVNASRLINKNGTPNVKRIGVPFLQRFSLYHYLIGTNWVHFLGLIFLFYFITNLIFGSVYMLIGVSQLQGTNANSHILQFWDAFFFSAQTLSTVGYGRIAPVGIGANVLASIESLLGLLSFALITGLGYGRFAKPDASLIVSQNMLVSPYLGGYGLMFRFGNARNESLIDAHVEVMFSHLTPNYSGTMARAFPFVNLERSKVGLLSQTWTVVHPIDDESPMFAMNAADFETNDVEVLVFFKAYDEKFNQTVHRRFSFKHHEIIWNAKFSSMLSVDNKSTTVAVDFSKINDYTAVLSS